MSKSTDTKDEAADEAVAAKKTAILVHIVVFVLITVAAAGAGFGASMFLKASGAVTEMQAHNDGLEEETEKKGDGEEKSDGAEEPAEGIMHAYATPLAPILTNLAAPSNLRIRMELAVVAKDKIPDKLLEKIHQDLFAYMRTVKLHHMDGPSGFINLKAELTDRASTRSGGAVQMVLVRTLVLE